MRVETKAPEHTIIEADDTGVTIERKGLVEITEGLVHGRPAITGYYITDKGRKYIKDHTSKFSNKLKKYF